jgi:parvulin-like peptidyl-prolyl isomerase
MYQQALAEATTSQPSDPQLREFYDKHPEKYSSDGILTVRHLVVPAQKVHDVVTALHSDTPVEEVIKRYGLTEPRNDGDEFYFAAKIHLGDALFAKALQVKPGEVVEPVQQPDGFHVVKVVQNKAPVPLTYDRAKLQVLTDYKNAQQEKLIAATMKFLRERSKILVATDYADYKP